MTDEVWQGNKAKHTSNNPLLKYMNREFGIALMDLSAQAAPSTILDIGCGEGFTTRVIADALPEAKITALDIEESYIEFAKKYSARDNVEYHQKDVFAEEFPAGSFELVVCNQVLEHLSNYREALSLFCHISTKYVLISVPREPWFRVSNILRFKYWKRLGNTPGHVNNWTVKEISEVVRTVGNIKEVRPSTLWTFILFEKH